jgi:hypothetical protein
MRFFNYSIGAKGEVEKVSETTQTVIPNTGVQPVQYILYDPARRKRRARRARRYDPAIVAYEPRRRRRASGMTRTDGQVALVDSALDGAAWGFIAKKLPVPSQSIGPLSTSDAVGVVGALVYEKFYMKRKWTHAFVSAAVAYMVGRWTT